MGLQDNRILSIPRHVGLVFFVCLFFKSFGLGRAFFFFFFCVLIFFFSAVIGCQHNLHQLEIRNQKKKKPQQQQKNQKAKTDLKPNSSEVHSYLLAGNQACSQGQQCGHSGATGTPYNQETRTRSATQPEAPHCSTQCEEVTTRRDTTHCIHLYFPLFWYLLRTEHL